MTAFNKPVRITRAVALLAVPALALALSTSSADARPSGYHGHGHGHGHVVHPAVAVPGVYTPYRVYAPYRAYRPYPVYSPYVAYTPYSVYAPHRGCAAPVVGPYRIAPVPYGSVVVDSTHGNVAGFVGLAGPNFSIGFGF